MFELDAANFDRFFSELWSSERISIRPFAWQKALAERVLSRSDQPWPEVIALPTAAGKTACIDIAVYALAAQAANIGTEHPLTAPRRIFFVVDRRVVVDEAFQRGQRLANKLRTAKKDSILGTVARHLRNLAHGDDPLACFQLRGGMYRSNAWARSPIQPTFVASTVDQIGSRLLFRGYGVSPKTWPIHAGLCGNDALILLDEAHCAQPFLETLRAVGIYRQWAERPLTTPFHAVVMSATPPTGSSDIFRDESDEPVDPQHVLGARQQARKPTTLSVARKAKGKSATAELAKVLSAEAERHAKSFAPTSIDSSSEGTAFRVPRHPAIVIFCNRVDTARFTHELLAKAHGDHAILLTGRMRPIDKDDILGGRLEELTASRAIDRHLDAPRFVVATQTLEVGADLDFDLLVSECAPLDALRQRFGRLNRMGRPVSARGTVVIRADQEAESDDDPVYGPALAATWRWLGEHACDGTIDLGIASLEGLLKPPTDIRLLNAPTTHAPVVLPPHVDILAQTAPTPVPSPDPAVFLHGSGRRSADVQVCWRSDLVGEPGEKWIEAVAICPPTSPECVAVPIWTLSSWLEGTPTMSQSDVEGVKLDEDRRSTPGGGQTDRQVIRWIGPEDSKIIDRANPLRPGDVVVIPAALGGWDELATIGTSTPVADWGDRAGAMTRSKVVLRLHPNLIACWPASDAKDVLLQLVHEGTSRLQSDPDGLVEAIRAALSELAEAPKDRPWLWLTGAAQRLASDTGLSRGILNHPTGGLVLRGTKARQDAVPGLAFSDEDDVASSATEYVTLDEHLKGVESWAEKLSARCGLTDEVAASISLAARYHDLGKADPRFQAILAGGHTWKSPTLLAKSAAMPKGRSAFAGARRQARYPAGARHELLSLGLLDQSPELLPKDDATRDLLLHLVASHHGHCRPFAPMCIDEDTDRHIAAEVLGHRFDAWPNFRPERLDSGVADRFWRLTRRYGWWGLAYIEAVMRIADHRRSEWEEQR